jgi:hypothetical protein
LSNEASSSVVVEALRREVSGSRFDEMNYKQTTSVALGPQTNYARTVTATFWRNLMPTSADRGVSRGQRGGSLAVVNLSFLDRSRSISFK